MKENLNEEVRIYNETLGAKEIKAICLLTTKTL